MSISAAMAGGVIAFYQVGYGLAAFGVGPLLDAGVGLPTIYGLAAIVALGMGMMSFGVTHADLGFARGSARGCRLASSPLSERWSARSSSGACPTSSDASAC